jgi:hypothetical protein
MQAPTTFVWNSIACGIACAGGNMKNNVTAHLERMLSRTYTTMTFNTRGASHCQCLLLSIVVIVVCSTSCTLKTPRRRYRTKHRLCNLARVGRAGGLRRCHHGARGVQGCQANRTLPPHPYSIHLLFYGNAVLAVRGWLFVWCCSGAGGHR